jgi:hypothetical protein
MNVCDFKRFPCNYANFEIGEGESSLHMVPWRTIYLPIIYFYYIVNPMKHFLIYFGFNGSHVCLENKFTLLSDLKMN